MVAGLAARDGYRHVVMTSGGITSWATARQVVKQEGTEHTVLLFADTRVEDPDLYRFLDESAAQLGVELVTVQDGRTPWQVFRDQRMIGNSRIAPCSKYLKQIPCRKWLEENTDPDTTTVYVGIDWTETHRLPAIERAYRPWVAKAPLCEPPYVDKDTLIAEAEAAGLPIPRLYREGFPHNNCGGACVRGGQAQWVRLLRTDPQRYAAEEREEQHLRTVLGKDVAILRDRSGGITKPLPLTELRHRLTRGQAHDTADWGGCGCFTEPPTEPQAESQEDTMTTTGSAAMAGNTARALHAVPAAPVRRTRWTDDALLREEFPAPRWAVPGLLCEGLNLLAGAPKLGKSWLSLGIGAAIANGDPALGGIEVERGPVLYCALEDTGRRLQRRRRQMLANGDRAAPLLTLETACPTMPAGGDAVIVEWIEQNPGARLVIIDTFEKMRGRNPQGVSAYSADYAAAGRYKTIADNYGVPILLIHHVRKQGAEDWQDLVSGTNGLTGAMDATLVLERSRGQADGVLHVTGRDVVENDYAMSFDGTFWTKLDGSAADYEMSDTRADLLRLVREYPGSKPAQLAEALDIPAATVRKTLSRMADKGQLRVAPGGAYYPPEQASDTDHAAPVTPAALSLNHL